MRKLFPFYPLLLGVIWVLVTYQSNKQILPDWTVIISPALVVTGIVTAMFLLTQLFIRDWQKSALVTSVVFNLVSCTAMLGILLKLTA